jgi:hypothetical protein
MSYPGDGLGAVDHQDRKTAAFAERQHGLLTQPQAEESGIGRSSRHRRLESGRWELLYDGVYRVGGAPATLAQRRLAAVLAIGSLAAVSHRAAADVHGLWTSRPPVVEITTTDGLSPELDGVIVHRMADLHERWITRVDGVPCTTVARTLVDLGAVMPDTVVAEALDRALGRGSATIIGVRAALDAVARQGRRGVGVMRRVLQARTETEPVAGVFEARMSRLLAVQGLPAAVPEFEVWTYAGMFVARVDFAYPDLRLAMEVDGHSAHSSLDAFRRDRTRQNALVEAGWTVLRFTWTEVNRNSPHVGRTIRATRRRLAT